MMLPVHRWRESLLIIGFTTMVFSSDAGISRSANYSISSGSINMGGRASNSANYSNVGFISVQQTDEAKRPTATAGEGNSRIELRQTGFRLVTKAAIRAEKELTPLRPQILDLIPHQNLQLGDPISLEVKATGTQPMSFQWYFGRDPIEGETSHRLSLGQSYASHAGSYRVLVQNSVGYAWSNKIYVQFLEPPAISSAPASQTVLYGKAVLLSVEASGSPRLRYQWYHNHQPIPRANAQVLRLKALSETGGNYHVEVSNDVGTVQSAVASIQVHRPPYIQTAPRSQTAVVGEEVIFSVEAVGNDASGDTLLFQWYKGRELLEGETSQTLFLDSVSTEDAGTYLVEVRNELGSTKTRPFRLSLEYPPEIISQPAEVLSSPGGKAYFYVKAKGSRTLRYQWYKDGDAIRRANRNRLQIYPVELSDSGIYHVTIRNKVGSVESDPVSLILTEDSNQFEPIDWKAPFSRWTVLEDLIDVENSPIADLDKDGLPNLLEYAFFGNPLTAETGITPDVSLKTGEDGTPFVKLSWREATEATNIRYELQHSANLTDWTTLDLARYATNRTNSGAYSTVEVYLPVETNKTGFFRIQVSQE